MKEGLKIATLDDLENQHKEIYFKQLELLKANRYNNRFLENLIDALRSDVSFKDNLYPKENSDCRDGSESAGEALAIGMLEKIGNRGIHNLETLEQLDEQIRRNASLLSDLQNLLFYYPTATFAKGTEG